MSKKLVENGCNLNTNNYYEDWDNHKIGSLGIPEPFPKYDILNDICVKYRKEFFIEVPNKDHKACILQITTEILQSIQDGVKQEIIEDRIWQHCKFNPDNKG